MAEIIDVGVLLTFDEIKILLHAMQVRFVKGIFMPQTAVPEADIISALHHMAEGGLIRTEENAFVIRSDLQEMLRIMADPEETFIWKPETGSDFCQDELQVPEYFCYVGSGKVLVSEQYWKKKNSMKLRVFSQEDFEKWKEQVRDDYCRY